MNKIPWDELGEVRNTVPDCILPDKSVREIFQDRYDLKVYRLRKKLKEVNRLQKLVGLAYKELQQAEKDEEAHGGPIKPRNTMVSSSDYIIRPYKIYSNKDAFDFADDLINEGENNAEISG